MKFNILILTILIWSCTPLAQSTTGVDSQAKVLRNIDFTYEPQIRTMVLRPALGESIDYLQPAVARLGQINYLRLAFDDLRPDRDSYYLRIVHCTRNWEKSGLQDLDFMTDFNEVPVNNFEFSVDTHIPYTRYWVNLPPVKLPGNYLAVVYRGSDKEDIILSKRFMIYDTRITFENEANLVGASSLASLNQQINFSLNYKHIELVNPLENVNVMIRQNQRWDNVAMNIKPSFVREIEKQLEYRFFDEDKMFRGGNEFRFFDLRSLNSPGRNVAVVQKNTKPFEAFIEKDKPKTTEAYSQYVDYNGGFIIDNLDYRDENFTNYAYVNFTLASRPVAGNVYVAGGFNYWNANEENLMRYDSARREYQARVLLKQGWYDYQYVVKSSSTPPLFFEGSHFETENVYEIFVYYTAFQPRADLLIGYMRLEKNAR
jgi:hypothetical protein